MSIMFRIQRQKIWPTPAITWIRWMPCRAPCAPLRRPAQREVGEQRVGEPEHAGVDLLDVVIVWMRDDQRRDRKRNTDDLRSAHIPATPFVYGLPLVPGEHALMEERHVCRHDIIHISGGEVPRVPAFSAKAS